MINRRLLLMYSLLALLVTMTLVMQGGITDPQVPRTWWPSAKAYVDSASAHRIFTLYVDEVGDQTLAKFPLEDDITIERVTFFSQAAVSGDTTALYSYEGTAIRDSVIIDSGAVYLDFATNFDLLNDSAFVAFTLSDAQWGGTAAGGTNTTFTFQYRVKRE